MKFSTVFSAISVFLHCILFYTIFFVKLCCSKFSYFLLIYYLNRFRLVSHFLTFRVKFSQIRKFPFKLKPGQQDRYRSVCYDKQEITINNLFQFFDYFYLKAPADIVVNY